MASILTNSIRARPVLISSAIVGGAATVYYANNRRILLDSRGAGPETKTFSFPSSMIFAKDLTVTSVEQVNHDTKRITFALPNSSDASGVPPSSALLTSHSPSGRFFPVLRPYTPVQDSDSRGVIEFLVKKYPGGQASTHLHSLEPGSKLTFRGPLPGYTWKASASPRDVIFVAGGAGITPIYSLTKAVVTDTSDKTRINLLWGVNGTRDIILKEELESLQSKYPDRLKVTYVVSGPEGKADAPSLGQPEKYRKGYIDRALLEESVKQLSSSFGDEKGTKVFFCGPDKMQSSITGKNGILSQLGIEKKNTHVF